MANWGEELERALDSLSRLCFTYPYRGLKGAVGTRLDQITLLGDSKAEHWDQKVMAIRAPANWESVGQVYPRRLLEVVSVLVRLSAAPASFAKTCGSWPGTSSLKGFAKGQTGSSQCPQDEQQKLRANQRLSSHPQRSLAMVSLSRAINGTKGTPLFGGQWVVYLDAFFALDGLLDTFLTVFSQMEFSRT